jgi:hypothetical protein
MPTKWVVTVPTDRIELDETQQGQTTFTVTNPSSRVDRVYFDVVTGDGADESWFTVDQPQRRVPASGSVSYLVKTAIPMTAKPGTYSVQGRAYSADSAPEEDSVLSGRLAVEIKAKAAPAAKKKFPWWIAVVAALVVIVLVVVGALVFGGGGTPKAEQVTVPDLAHQSESQAKTNLAVFGLTAGTIQHKQDATADQVLYQSVPGGGKAAKGSAVDLVVTVNLAPPVVTSPASGSTVQVALFQPAVRPVPTTPQAAGATATPTPVASAGTDAITWTDPDAFVKHWQLTVQEQYCYISACAYITKMVVRVDKPSYTPILFPFDNHPGVVTLTGVYTVLVAAVDDFGNAGPNSQPTTFAVK